MRWETLVQPQHLERLAMVYVRQSTPGQVLQNQESTRLQYGLRERAEQLGWPRDRIQTVDEDLGVSGSGQEERRGFARLVLEVARAKVGAVFGLDASRFSRNGAEWFELLRWLRATGTLLVTDEGVYDASNGDDSFVLGILCRILHNSPTKKSSSLGHIVMSGSMRKLLLKQPSFPKLPNIIFVHHIAFSCSSRPPFVFHRGSSPASSGEVDFIASSFALRSISA